MSEKKFVDELLLMFRAGIPVIWVLGPGDEHRCLESLVEALKSAQKRDLSPDASIFRWTSRCVMQEIVSSVGQTKEPDTKVRPEDLIPYVINSRTPGFFMLQDFATILNSPKEIGLRRSVITAVQENAIFNTESDKTVFLFSSEPPCPEIKEYVRIVELPYPTVEEVTPVVQESVSWSKRLPQTPEFINQTSRSLSGLFMGEVSRVVSIATSYATSEKEFRDRISLEKGKSLKSAEGLTFTPHERLPDPQELAGYDNFIQWLEIRKHAYSDAAESIGIPYPKGTLIVGIPGTGKSVMAKAGAQILGMDLVEMDFGSMFGSLVGQSESRLRNALRAIEAMGNVYLMIDEIDAAIGGMNKGQASDGGTGSRMLGHLLSWMTDRSRSDRENKTFIMATANRMDILPPPLIRAGRFDKIFYTDLPSTEAACEILYVHLKKRGISVEEFDPKSVSAMFQNPEYGGRTGAEISQAVDDAVLHAYARDPETYSGPTLKDVEIALQGITPIRKTMAAEIENIRNQVQQNGLTPVYSGKGFNSSNPVYYNHVVGKTKIRPQGNPENN